MLFKTLDRTVHESSNRSDNHYYNIKINLEIFLISTIRKLDSINIMLTLLFGIIFTNYFKQIDKFSHVNCLVNTRTFIDIGRHGQI